MVVFRVIGLIFVALALMTLGADGLSSLEAGEIKIRSFSDLWAILHQPSLDAFGTWSSGALPPAVVDPGVSTLMSLPAWVVLGILGIILAFLFRRRG